MAKFEKGHPGGPGRPRGSRNKSTLILEAIARKGGPGVVRAMMRKATAGDVPAARLMMPRFWPAGTFVEFDLPPVTDAAGVADAQACVLAAAGNKELSLEQADRYSKIIENRRRALETAEIERNLREAEEVMGAHAGEERLQ